MADDIPISTEDSPSVILELIYKLKIKDVMTSALITARRTDSLRHIQSLMKENYITGVPIAEDRRLLGIVSIDDIVTALDRDYIDESAERRMTRNVIVLEDDMPLSFAVSYFNKYGFGRFPVLDKKRELVGIITSRDINTSLLMEVNRIVEELEGAMDTAPPPVEGTYTKQFPVKKHDFENAGKASTEIKKYLKTRGIHSKIIRRIAVAGYELEMNLVVHSEGGKLFFNMDKTKVEIRAVDTGPGIPDVEKAQELGFSTANEWIRSLGFGAGMGLPNVKRVSDEFSIESGEGTEVRSVIYIREE